MARFSLSFTRFLFGGLAFAIFGLYACTSKPPVPSRQNVAANYRPTSEIALAADHLMLQDSMKIWLRFGNRAIFKGRYPHDLTLQLRVNQTYESTQPLYSDSVVALEGKAQWQGERAVVTFGIPRKNLVQGGVVSITLLDRVGEQTSSLLIPLTAPALDKQLVLLEANTTLPLFRHYLNPLDSFRIATASRGMAIKAVRYKADFPAALPPMSLSPKKVAPNIPVLDSLQLSTEGTIKLQQPGLYQLKPTQGSACIALVEEDEFPELTTARDLIDPLIYITTSKERNQLYQAAEPKKAVDKFWLNIGGSELFARTLIRSYYGRVTDANKLFSSHKPGWKSDRGMIYIVLGQPDVVNRYADREEWTFDADKDRPATVFTFIRRDNPLTQNHYELQRDPVFEPVWYKSAERWRKGITGP